jgi:transcriptional regulator with XRE-family HTH domain
VRKFLGQRLRALRKERGLSQERLGERAGLSGKFIGEVERGEKSISIDSLYHVAVALDIPLPELTNLQQDRARTGVSEDAQRIFALVARHGARDVRKAYAVLRAMLGPAPGEGRTR